MSQLRVRGGVCVCVLGWVKRRVTGCGRVSSTESKEDDVGGGVFVHSVFGLYGTDSDSDSNLQDDRRPTTESDTSRQQTES
jgi:hypothetical protein